MVKDYNVKVDYDKLLKRLESIPVRTDVALMMKANSGAKKMQNYAKKYRPWTDRTGNARRTLHGYVKKYTGYIRIFISHGMSYGWSLEYDHGKKYAILFPTVQACSAEILKSLNGIVKSW